MDTALLDQYNIDCGVSLCLSAQTGERKKKKREQSEWNKRTRNVGLPAGKSPGQSLPFVC